VRVGVQGGREGGENEGGHGVTWGRWATAKM
jgi:hypothetical protein